ncbi:MAG: tripartite tricarboxylate transporter substrate binding protein [Methylibium sp.]|nr:tripartite tricarboxylate transporter substrate binding protein [Methylibium sp.]
MPTGAGSEASRLSSHDLRAGAGVHEILPLIKQRSDMNDKSSPPDMCSPSDHDAPALSRRRALGLAGGVALSAGGVLAGWPLLANAQDYPSKTVRMVIAFPPAGATDILARAVAQRLGDTLGQQIVVENKPGAGGMIGLENAAQSAPDGYNLFLCALTNQAIAGHLYPNATSDISRDFEPVSLLANGAHMLNVHPSVPAKTLPEFIQWLKANDGKVTYASQGNGTLSHLETELLAQRLNLKLTHIPYKGSSQALPDLLAGTVSFMFDSVAASMVHVKAGKLRALAVAATQRVPAFPDLPTVAEGGVPGYDVDNWFGLFVPKGTPADIVKRLNADLAKVLADPELGKVLVQQGYAIQHGDPAKLAAVTKAERSKWGEVIKTANVTIR